jgi:hypothetical protein
MRFFKRDSRSRTRASRRLAAEQMEARRLLAVGATVPWVRYEAEDGVVGQAAAVLQANRTIGDLAGEASGRRAVKLAATGDYVEWRVTAPANALTMRLSIPDAVGGGGIDSTIGLYRNGQLLQNLNVTSKYAWLYGDDSSVSNDPAAGPARRLYDESNTLLATALVPGDTIRVQKAAGNTAASYTIDFIELENVSSLARPANSISIIDYGAVANDSGDDTAAIVSAIAAARTQGKRVWMPAGQFRQSSVIAAEQVEIVGAGMWHTEIWGYNPRGDNAVGFRVTGGGAVFRDFRIRGEQTLRGNTSWATSGFCGAFGTGSEVHDVWIEHTQCGAWVGVDNTTNPATNLVFDGLRIRNVFADGINLCNGTTGTSVINCTARATGDDSFASWSAPAAPRANSGNTFRNNTSECTWKAAGFAVYGGADTLIENNLVTDTLTYPGVTIAASFGAKPFAGTTTVRGNTLLRCGGLAWGQQHGALWVYVDDSSIAAPVTVDTNLVIDSTYSAFEVNASNRGNSVTGPLTFTGNTVVGADWLVRATYYAAGTATFQGTRIAGLTQTGLVTNASGGKFTVTLASTTSTTGPVLVMPASASTTTAAGLVGLSALAADDDGDAGLTYTWSAQGPAAVGFDRNGTSAARTSVATFAAAGTYVLAATIRNAAGATVTSSVTVTATSAASDATPVVVVPVSVVAGSAPVRTATVSVLASDDGGEAALRYAWSATGPAVVAFADSGTNAAKTTGATFAAAGTYVITAVVSDARGFTAASSATYVVEQVLSAVTVATATGTTLTESSQQITATAVDQFGAELGVQPQFTWSASRGAISATGLYASPAASGQAVVTAVAGGVAGTATVAVDAFSARQDVGSVGRVGSDSFSAADGVYTVSGSGADIWNTADGFRYVSRTVSGDATFVARVVSQTATDPWAKAGVMLREGTAAGAKFAAIFTTPSNGVTFQWRSSTGGSAASVQTTGVAAPRWVKLTRVGGSYAAFQSGDGTTWVQVGQPVSLTMTATATAGLAVTAHNNGLLSTATFSGVSLVTAASLAPAVLSLDVASGSLTQGSAGYPELPAGIPIVKTGGGTLLLENRNPGTDSVAIRAGTIRIAHEEAVAAAAVVVERAASLALSPFVTSSVARLVLDGSCDVGSGSMTVMAGWSAADALAAINVGIGTGSWDGLSGITSSVAAAAGLGSRGIGWLQNGDGSITFSYAAPGDTNLDSAIDVLDAANLLTAGLFNAGLSATWGDGDFTYDGIVDILDVAWMLGTSLYNDGNYVEPLLGQAVTVATPASTAESSIASTDTIVTSWAAFMDGSSIPSSDPPRRKSLTGSRPA